MDHFAAIVLSAILSLSGTRAMTALDYGMTMTERAYSAICWYETLKKFPDTKSDQYRNCGGLAQQIQDQINTFKEQSTASREFTTDDAMTLYGGSFKDLNLLDGLPNGKEYVAGCGNLLTTPKADAATDESDVLNDQYKPDYPYKAFAFCLMKIFKDVNGEEAVEAVKAERTFTMKHWMKTIFDRDNEFRKRHGMEEFKLAKELVEGAQEWAENNAKGCQGMYEKRDKLKMKTGEKIGESIVGQAFGDDKQMAAYLASDGWYEQVKNYPFPGGYEGDGKDGLFKSFGHFTQTVWLATKYVGYGYAWNEECGNGGEGYIVARYFPAGNVKGNFTKNVFPPINAD